jgi:hypothetical protein
MEPRQSEKSVESRGEGQASPTLQPERKRRFQIIKLEERIAPGGGDGKASNLTFCHCSHPCHGVGT